MKSIKVHYFAHLRELAGTESESLETELATYAELYHYLSAKHGFTLPFEMIQLAVDDEFTSPAALLVDGSKVVFIPPVAGG